ncbi:MAG: hypothetical protein Q8O19_07485 [Rectinemataceae bacterium]|nr:hypothetical protein [Rectinemataceae bacterium]
MNQIQRREQKWNKEAEPYRMTPEEMVEEAWFEQGERLSNPPDLRDLATRRWEIELSL